MKVISYFSSGTILQGTKQKCIIHTINFIKQCYNTIKKDLFFHKPIPISVKELMYFNCLLWESHICPSVLSNSDIKLIYLYLNFINMDQPSSAFQVLKHSFPFSALKLSQDSKSSEKKWKTNKQTNHQTNKQQPKKIYNMSSWPVFTTKGCKLIYTCQAQEGFNTLLSCGVRWKYHILMWKGHITLPFLNKKPCTSVKNCLFCAFTGSITIC